MVRRMIKKTPVADFEYSETDLGVDYLNKCFDENMTII